MVAINAMGWWQGPVAALVGVVGTVVFLWGTWVVVQFTTAGASDEKPRLAKTVVMSLALLLKLPLIYAGWLLSHRLGPFGPTWFLGGLGLVYSALVFRAVLAVRG